jgi:hypothetical protein
VRFFQISLFRRVGQQHRFDRVVGDTGGVKILDFRFHVSAPFRLIPKACKTAIYSRPLLPLVSLSLLPRDTYVIPSWVIIGWGEACATRSPSARSML